MPIIVGYTAARKTQSDPALRSIPIIAVEAANWRNAGLPMT
jgi:CheY-like chemotaxis protein